MAELQAAKTIVLDSTDDAAGFTLPPKASGNERGKFGDARICNGLCPGCFPELPGDFPPRCTDRAGSKGNNLYKSFP